jgi:hypothetical protein
MVSIELSIVLSCSHSLVVDLIYDPTNLLKCSHIFVMARGESQFLFILVLGWPCGFISDKTPSVKFMAVSSCFFGGPDVGSIALTIR